uniref:Uncharacterized protein n=1 Tax=Anguilla anguilla TaxID=7936 RepID=A0A0E9VLN4_ANGAN
MHFKSQEGPSVLSMLLKTEVSKFVQPVGDYDKRGNIKRGERRGV